jgi:hypothetical protein
MDRKPREAPQYAPNPSIHNQRSLALAMARRQCMAVLGKVASAQKPVACVLVVPLL